MTEAAEEDCDTPSLAQIIHERLHFECHSACAVRLQEIEGRYRANPYHNAMHAADVTQSALCMLAADRMDEHLTPIELMCIIIACCIHDVGHYGVNNDFLVKTANEWALIYNDNSVNENMHVRVAFEVLQEPRNNIFTRVLLAQL
jgi:calcium/calmodulin-dependent 3',5'-cyclic nucleotide phosphodiesterase